MSLSRSGRMRGFSLIELAVVLVALGLVTLVVVRFLGTAANEQRTTASRNLLSRADDALLAYVMVNSRLPCPANDANGLEDCSGGQIGRLPYKTLGLPDASARSIRYGVLRRTDSDQQKDADLASLIDRYYPLQVQTGTETALELPVGNLNGLDMCRALRNAEKMPLDDHYLHLTGIRDTAQIDTHVAYALALPGDGTSFSGHQTSASPVFDSPKRPQSADFHDRILAVGLDQLWSRMRCGDNLSAAGYAHFNADAAITLMHTALTDYEKQLAVAEKLADANVMNGAAAVSSGISATLSSGAGIADAIAEGLLSTGIVAYKVALASVATAAAIAVTVTAAALTGAAVDAQKKAQEVHAEVFSHIDEAKTLETSVHDNAKTADSIGLY